MIRREREFRRSPQNRQHSAGWACIEQVQDCHRVDCTLRPAVESYLAHKGMRGFFGRHTVSEATLVGRFLFALRRWFGLAPAGAGERPGEPEPQWLGKGISRVGRIRVAIAGATGKVGRELVKAFVKEPDIELVGATGRTGIGQDAGLFVGAQEAGVKIAPTLAEVLEHRQVDVLVDFTRAEVGRENIPLALEHGVAVVVGTTGFTKQELQSYEELAYRQGVGAAIIANFAIGAMLITRFAEQARKFFPQVEIVEMHHETKVDKPSGTSLRMAQRLEKVGGSPVPIHSLRVPGAVAHHEIVFGGPGQIVTLRHDSISRESFVPGVLLAVRKVRSLRGAVYDLDELVDLP